MNIFRAMTTRKFGDMFERWRNLLAAAILFLGWVVFPIFAIWMQSKENAAEEAQRAKLQAECSAASRKSIKSLGAKQGDFIVHYSSHGDVDLAYLVTGTSTVSLGRRSFHAPFVEEFHPRVIRMGDKEYQDLALRFNALVSAG